MNLLICHYSSRIAPVSYHRIDTPAMEACLCHLRARVVALREVYPFPGGLKVDTAGITF